ncbi:MAG: hypothetical protein ABI700_01415, partial [Chloroflexota bacterium]
MQPTALSRSPNRTRLPSSREFTLQPRVIIARLLVYSILLGWLLMSLFPFYWMFVSSFKPVSEIFTFPPVLIPLNPTIANYQ